MSRPTRTNTSRPRTSPATTSEDRHETTIETRRRRKVVKQRETLYNKHTKRQTRGASASPGCRLFFFADSRGFSGNRRVARESVCSRRCRRTPSALLPSQRSSDRPRCETRVSGSLPGPIPSFRKPSKVRLEFELSRSPKACPQRQVIHLKEVR